MNPVTLVFCTCFAADLSVWETRYRRWIDAIRSSRLIYKQILIVDDGSPCRPDWPDVVFVAEGEQLPYDAEIIVYRFNERLGRHSVRNYPGWYRSFCFGGSYANDIGAGKVIHLESDAFLISGRIQDFFNKFNDGWGAPYLARYGMPESAIQIVAGSAMARLSEFCQIPYRDRVEHDIENIIPFDIIFKDYIGDRYGEKQDYIPCSADWSVQVFPPLRNEKTYFWWLNEGVTPKNNGVKSKMPVIIALSMVKNEQDIIEPFIRHTNMFVDHHIVLDNGSVDETRPILTHLMRELDGLTVTTSSEFGYTQSDRMSKLLRACQTAFFADYVIFLDADEFISSESRIEFEQILSFIPVGGYGRIPWRTFLLTPFDADDNRSDPPRSIPWRRASEHPRLNAVVRLGGKYWHDLVIGQGNHDVFSNTGRHVESVELPYVYLDHFPVRSEKQFITKCVVGWMAYLSKDPEAGRKGDGYHWLHHYRMVASGNKVSYEALCDLSMRYDQPPREYSWSRDVIRGLPPSRYERRYSSGEFGDPLGIVAKCWQTTLEAREPVLLIERKAISQDIDVESASDTAFEPDWHWDNPFADIPPFTYLVEKFQPKSILDVGCGMGAYVTLFKNLGVDDSFGVDGIPISATVLADHNYRKVDLSQPVNIGRTFDIVMCLEVAEHLPYELAPNLLVTLGAHSQGLIVFSAGEPGQPGINHINCLPIEQWLRRWQALGWIPLIQETFAMRAISTLPWFKRNIVVLRQGESGEGEAAIRELARIGNMPFVWNHCNSGIRYEVLTEDVPPPPTGYKSEA